MAGPLNVFRTKKTGENYSSTYFNISQTFENTDSLKVKNNPGKMTEQLPGTAFRHEGK
jgi:hypothetical protein